MDSSSLLRFIFIFILKGEEVWETPIGRVVEGMENVKQFYEKYGDMPPWGEGPEQWRIEEEGVEYMEQNYPLMDKFETCTVKILYPNNPNERQHVSRELLAGDLRSITDLQNRPKPYHLTVTAHDANNLRSAGQVKALGISLSESELTKLIGIVGISFLFTMMFLLTRKEKQADKKN